MSKLLLCEISIKGDICRFLERLKLKTNVPKYHYHYCYYYYHHYHYHYHLLRGFHLCRRVIGFALTMLQDKNLHHFSFNQSKTKTNHAITLSFDWFIVLPVSFVIGLGFGFTTLN